MSTYWEASASLRTSKVVEIKVVRTHVDVGDVPTSAAFVLELICEAFDSESGLLLGLFEAQLRDYGFLESASARVFNKVEVLETQTEADVEQKVVERLREDGVEEGSDDWDDAADEARGAEENRIFARFRVEARRAEFLYHLKPRDRRATCKNWDSAAYPTSG